MKIFNFFQNKKLTKRLNIYWSALYNKVLLVPVMIDQYGIFCEQEEIEILEFNCADNILGEKIKKNLDKFTSVKRDKTKRNLKDWPTFKASKLKTVKEFKKEFHCISISGENESNIILIIEADLKSLDKINLKSSISAFCKDEELGFKIKTIQTAQINKKVN